MRKKLGFGLFLALLLATPVFNAQAYEIDQQSSSSEIKLIDDIIKDEEVQKKIDAYMIEHYGKDYKDKLDRNEQAVGKITMIDSNFDKDEFGEAIYPSYIGGLYIDENDNIVIELVKNNISRITSENYKMFKKIINIDPTVKIKYVDFSNKELKKLYKTLFKYLGKVDNFMGLYVDVISNKVVVELEDCNEESIKEFQNSVLDSSMISFVKGTKFEDITNINPGTGFTSNSGKGCSYGYRATYGGTVGIVSAGHCFTGTSDYIPNVGNVMVWQNSGVLDVAFIATNSGYTPTNMISIPALGVTVYLNTTISTSLATGQNTAKYGQATGYTAGTILSTNYSYTDNGVTYFNLIRTSMSANNGDSGGISYQPSTNQGTNLTLGIMKAKSSNGKQSLVTKAYVIYSTYALTRY